MLLTCKSSPNCVSRSWPSHQRLPLTRRRQRENTLLGQRLLALEEKLQSLERDRGVDRPPARDPVPTERHPSAASVSPSGGLQSQFAGSPERPSDQDDMVDGMGSIAFKDRPEEHEYFGKEPQSHRNPSHERKLNISTLLPWHRRLIQPSISKGHCPCSWQPSEPRGPCITGICHRVSCGPG